MRNNYTWRIWKLWNWNNLHFNQKVHFINNSKSPVNKIMENSRHKAVDQVKTFSYYHNTKQLNEIRSINSSCGSN